MKHTSIRTELIAGCTTFLTMSYIIFLNPAILSTNGTGLGFSEVMTATILLSFSMTLLMGLYAKLPFAVAPGMGINAYFTYGLILGKGIEPKVALGMVVWAGVLFVFFSFTRFRESIVNAFPPHLRVASGVGIGIFLALIGFKNAGIVIADPITILKMGSIRYSVIFTFIGLAVSAYLYSKKNPFSFLSAIAVVTVLAAINKEIAVPTHFFAWPNFGLFGKMDLIAPLTQKNIPMIMGIALTDLFDSISTFVGVAIATKLVLPDGSIPRLREGLLVDALATLTAGIFGTSSGTAYIESSAGIEAGGRTGLTAVVAALCFLPFLFLSPIVGMIPLYASAPVLIIVGGLMFRSIQELSFRNFEEAIPAFLTITLIPLTFSITQGLFVGIISHALLFSCVGRIKEIKLSMWILTAVAMLLLQLEHGM